MTYRNNRKIVLFAIIVVTSTVAIAVWQFYMFATFKNANGISDAQGGTQHFWWAVGLGLLAFTIAFLFFSVFLRYDTNDETHITSRPSRKRLSYFSEERHLK